MSDNIEYGEIIFDDISKFGDNTNRVDDIMAVPSIGQSSIVRYKVPTDKNAKVNCIAIGCNYENLLLQGAYTTSQDGAQIQVRFNSTIKYEQKFNWTGLQGYIGGADDYNSEAEVMISGYDTEIDANTVIDVYVTGKTNVRRMFYITIIGQLSDGTKVYQAIRQAVDGTTATAISVYTVPAGLAFDLRQLVISTRHIDLYAGKGYIVYNGIPIMAVDINQTEIGGVYGLVLPFYDLPLKESASIGVRLDSYSCGNEVVSASVYSVEESIGGSSTGFPVVGNTGLVRVL